MATLAIIDGRRFFVPSNDHRFPAHLHVEQGDCQSKWNLNPVELVESSACKAGDLRKIKRMIIKEVDRIWELWNAEWNRRQPQ